MSWVVAGVAGGSALLKLGSGLIQGGKANSIENQMQYPIAPVQPEFQQNVNQWQQMTQQGIPAPAYNAQLNDISRNQAAGVTALSHSANPGANLAALVGQGDTATMKLNAQDALERNRNMLGLLNARLQLAQQKDKAWDWNYQQKYLQNLAKANQLRGAANSNISGAFSELGGTATNLAGLGAFTGSGGGSTPSVVDTTPNSYVNSGFNPVPFSGVSFGDFSQTPPDFNYQPKI